MDQKYFNRLGRIKCANGEPDYLRISGFHFRLEAMDIGNPGYKVALVVSCKKQVWHKEFDRILGEIVWGRGRFRDMNPDLGDSELSALAKANGMTAKKVAARVAGNTMVTNGAKLVVFYCEDDVECLEFVLSFRTFLNSIRIPVGEIPIPNFSYDYEAAGSDYHESVVANGDQ